MDSRNFRRHWIVLAAGVVLLGGGGAAWMLRGSFPGGSGKPAAPSAPFDDVEVASIRRFCSQHHVVPAPEALPQSVWAREIDLMYENSGSPREGGIGVPPRDRVLAFYEGRAPARIEPPRGRADLGPGPFRFLRKELVPPEAKGPPAVGFARFVRFVRGGDPRRLEILLTDARSGQVILADPSLPEPAFSVLARVPHPSRAEAVDLDRDGNLDFLVGNLGSFESYDHEKGSIVWLRGLPGGRFEPATLADGLGQTTDVKAADLDGDGDLDLAAAVFGWRAAGQVLYLQNRTKTWDRPSFAEVALDQRPGALDVRIADIDRDGREDIIALVSQNSECIEAFLNRGPGEPFQVENLWTGPHPAFGTSGIDLADLDGDGDLDVLLANGDTLDNGLILPWQGLRWLENRGGFLFEERLFEPLAGCYSPRAADLDGDGDLDIALSSYLPFTPEKERRDLGLESVAILEQTAPGAFARRVLEASLCVHPSLDIGDPDGDGDLDLVLGNFVLDPGGSAKAPVSAVTVLENLMAR